MAPRTICAYLCVSTRVCMYRDARGSTRVPCHAEVAQARPRPRRARVAARACAPGTWCAKLAHVILGRCHSPRVSWGAERGDLPGAAVVTWRGHCPNVPAQAAQIQKSSLRVPFWFNRKIKLRMTSDRPHKIKTRPRPGRSSDRKVVGRVRAKVTLLAQARHATLTLHPFKRAPRHQRRITNSTSTFGPGTDG